MNDTTLKTQDLSIGYRYFRRSDTEVMNNISIKLNLGELVCVLGPNGVGKSTLLRTLAGMQAPLAGNIWLGGSNIQALSPQTRARYLSLVLTERVEVGFLSVYALVALGRYPYTNWQGRFTPEDEKIVRWAIDFVGVTKLVKRNVAELSDGERQKVMIARALAQEPQLIILDEPTAYLDLPYRVTIMHLLRKLAREKKLAILLATHDLDLALRNADKLWLLPPHGNLCIGTPEDLVLNGTFEKVFSSFNRQTGTFQTLQTDNMPIRLIGDGTVALWTEKALLREGFSVVSDQTPIQIKIVDHDTAFKWQLITEHHIVECTSIEMLLVTLRKIKSQH